MDRPSVFLIFMMKRLEFFGERDGGGFYERDKNNYSVEVHVVCLLEKSYSHLSEILANFYPASLGSPKNVPDPQKMRKIALKKSSEFKSIRNQLLLGSKLSNCTKTATLSTN